MTLLASFLYLCLHIAVILFVAFAILWVLRWCNFEPDTNMLKVGKVIVGLLILIAVVLWLSQFFGSGPYMPTWLR